jgi:hypothetical protein
VRSNPKKEKKKKEKEVRRGRMAEWPCDRNSSETYDIGARGSPSEGNIGMMGRMEYCYYMIKCKVCSPRCTGVEYVII